MPWRWLAAQRRTDSDVGQICAALDHLRATSDDPEAGLHAHRAFHEQLYRASHNPILIDMLDGLRMRSGRYRQFGRAAGTDAPSLAEQRPGHDRLTELVTVGDAEAASGSSP